MFYSSLINVFCQSLDPQIPTLITPFSDVSLGMRCSGLPLLDLFLLLAESGIVDDGVDRMSKARWRDIRGFSYLSKGTGLIRLGNQSVSLKFVILSAKWISLL